MNFTDLAREALRSLEANRGRSLLTILGIVIGIAAVIAMTSLIGGVRNSLIGGMGLNAARIVYINCGYPLTDDDIDDLERLLPDYEAIEGTYDSFTQVQLGDKTINAGITGASPEFLEMTGAASKLAEGRIFTSLEAEASSRVALIGRNGVEAFFGSPGAEAISKTIQLNNKSYTVLGVLDDGMTGTDYCNIYMPKDTVLQDFSQGWEYLSSVVGLAREGVDIDAIQASTIEQVGQLKNIAEEDRESMISVWSMKSSIDQLDTFMMSFQLMLGSVAGISLLVGGIGIMNMMLTNVTERIREIGLRKSLGARRRDITKQFLLEAIMLCVAGGAFGIVFGFLAAWGLGQVIGAVQAGMAVTPVLAPGVVFGAVAVCVLIGVVFGYYPARRAAKLDPVESLRYQ